ncbi:hypothetical protein JW921_04385 [Candidatus Fermentibacterales bacterium]|nr:hypothetical protein [Candidatus Fermentibacterales bacterium]
MTARHVPETHRNDYYVVGSTPLAGAAGAHVRHAGSHLDYLYGEAAEDGQTPETGRLVLEAMHTPGHTPGSMSYLLSDPSGSPCVIFTGNRLFAGEVGRVDLAGEDLIEQLASDI